jgi:hypothetical protein
MRHMDTIALFDPELAFRRLFKSRASSKYGCFYKENLTSKSEASPYD